MTFNLYNGGYQGIQEFVVQSKKKKLQSSLYSDVMSAVAMCVDID